jgi:hypothetical protein
MDSFDFDFGLEPDQQSTSTKKTKQKAAKPAGDIDINNLSGFRSRSPRTAGRARPHQGTKPPGDPPSHSTSPAPNYPMKNRRLEANPRTARYPPWYRIALVKIFFQIHRSSLVPPICLLLPQKILPKNPSSNILFESLEPNHHRGDMTPPPIGLRFTVQTIHDYPFYCHDQPLQRRGKIACPNIIQFSHNFLDIPLIIFPGCIISFR